MDDKRDDEIADQWTFGTDKDGNVFLDVFLNVHKRTLYLNNKEVTILARLLTGLAECPEWILDHSND